MKQRIILLAVAAGVLLGAAGLGITASVTSQPSLIAKVDYLSLKEAIDQVLDDEEAACQALRPAARQECLAEVRATTAVQLADLEVRYRGTVRSANKARLIRIDAAYDVARAKCFGMAGFERDTCIVAAHAQKAHARMQAQAEQAPPPPQLAHSEEEVEG